MRRTKRCNRYPSRILGLRNLRELRRHGALVVVTQQQMSTEMLDNAAIPMGDYIERVARDSARSWVGRLGVPVSVDLIGGPHYEQDITYPSTTVVLCRYRVTEAA